MGGERAPAPQTWMNGYSYRWFLLAYFSKLYYSSKLGCQGHLPQGVME